LDVREIALLAPERRNGRLDLAVRQQRAAFDPVSRYVKAKSDRVRAECLRRGDRQERCDQKNRNGTAKHTPSLFFLGTCVTLARPASFRFAFPGEAESSERV
jgi:hypothetical protein